MELEQLRLFVEAAEHEGFSPAARSLYTSHSTISRAVSSLEAELDTQLFIREHKKLTLTQAGEILLKDAKELIAMTESMTEKIKVLR